MTLKSAALGLIMCLTVVSTLFAQDYTNVDVAIVRDVRVAQETRLQVRAEVFNVMNHVNLGLPVADLNSANFERIFSAGPPRLMQFAVKLIF